LFGLFAGLAVAAPQVYHSPGDDGAPAAGAPSIPEGGVQSVYLYIDGGSSASQPGTACDVGQGEEVCGYELVLTGLTGLTLSSFTPDTGANLVVNLAAGGMTINGLDTVSPSPGPQRIGELQVDAAIGGALELTSGETVGADLQTDPLATKTVVTVPEPGWATALGSGLALLAALGRRRGR